MIDMKEALNSIKSTVKAAHQESTAYLQDGVRVNDTFWYHVSKEYQNQIGIHLYETDVGKSIGGAKSFLKNFSHGLNELANLLESDPKLANIAEIVGWSDLVYKKPRLMKLLGFEITERNDKKEQALAKMNRKKFLTRPWKKVKTQIPTEVPGRTSE